MNWTFIIGDKDYSATYDNASFVTDSPLVEYYVNKLIDDGTVVEIGDVGPMATASFKTDAHAWGTITHAIRKLANIGSGKYPFSPLNGEDEIVEPGDKEPKTKSLGPSLSGVNEPFDPNAFDGDNDGIVQDSTQWERPALPNQIPTVVPQEVARPVSLTFTGPDPRILYPDIVGKTGSARYGNSPSIRIEHPLSPGNDIAFVSVRDLMNLPGNMPNDDGEIVFQERVEELKQELLSNGFRNPIDIAYDPTTGRAYVSEGNHRLHAAFAAGYSYIPATILPMRINENRPASIITKDLNKWPWRETAQGIYYNVNSIRERYVEREDNWPPFDPSVSDKQHIPNMRIHPLWVLPQGIIAGEISNNGVWGPLQPNAIEPLTDTSRSKREFSFFPTLGKKDRVNKKALSQVGPYPIVGDVDYPSTTHRFKVHGYETLWAVPEVGGLNPGEMLLIRDYSDEIKNFHHIEGISDGLVRMTKSGQVLFTILSPEESVDLRESISTGKPLSASIEQRISDRFVKIPGEDGTIDDAIDFMYSLLPSNITKPKQISLFEQEVIDEFTYPDGQKTIVTVDAHASHTQKSMTFWNGHTPTESLETMRTFFHEHGHMIDPIPPMYYMVHPTATQMLGDSPQKPMYFSDSIAWGAAVERDSQVVHSMILKNALIHPETRTRMSFISGKKAVSLYGTTDVREDFSEALAMYMIDKFYGSFVINEELGTNVRFAQLFPNRAQFFDDFIGTLYSFDEPLENLVKAITTGDFNAINSSRSRRIVPSKSTLIPDGIFDVEQPLYGSVEKLIRYTMDNPEINVFLFKNAALSPSSSQITNFGIAVKHSVPNNLLSRDGHFISVDISESEFEELSTSMVFGNGIPQEISNRINAKLDIIRNQMQRLHAVLPDGAVSKMSFIHASEKSLFLPWVDVDGQAVTQISNGLGQEPRNFIAIYSLNRHTESHLSNVLAHELGHVLDRDGGQNYKKTFVNQSSRWLKARANDKKTFETFRQLLDDEILVPISKNSTVPNIRKGKKGITEYGDQSDIEDFAETIKLYISDLQHGGLFRNKKTDEIVRFSDMFPNRHKVIKDFLSTYETNTTDEKIIETISDSSRSQRSTKFSHGSWETTGNVVEKISGKSWPNKNTPEGKRILDSQEFQSHIALTTAMDFWRGNFADSRMLARIMSGFKPPVEMQYSDPKFMNMARVLDTALENAKPMSVQAKVAGKSFSLPLYRSMRLTPDVFDGGEFGVGSEINFRAAAAAFSPSVAAQYNIDELTNLGIRGGMPSKIIVELPSDTKGLIFDDRETIVADEFNSKPVEAIIRGNFRVASIKKTTVRDPMTRKPVEQDIYIMEHVEPPTSSRSTRRKYHTTNTRLDIGDFVVSPRKSGKENEVSSQIDFNDSSVVYASPNFADVTRGIEDFASSGRYKDKDGPLYMYQIEDASPASLSSDTFPRNELSMTSSRVERGKVTGIYKVSDDGDAFMVSGGSRSKRGDAIKSSKKQSDSRRAKKGKTITGTQGIDEESLNPEYIKAMYEKMEKYGFNEEMIDSEVDKILKSISRTEINKGRRWYSFVNRKTRDLVEDINSKYGSSFSFEQGAAILAALSPAREFVKNVRDAKKLMQAIAMDEDFEITEELLRTLKAKPEKIQEFLERAGDGKIKPSEFLDRELDILVGLHPVFSTLGGKTGFGEAIKGISIARGITTAENGLSGPKVRSFYSNIVNPNGTRVTIDTWMYRIMLPEDFAFTYRGKTDTVRGHEERKIEKVKVQDIFQGTPSGFGIGDNVGLYPIFAAAIRRAAIKYNMPPSAIQAIIWEIARQKDGKKPTDWDKAEAAFAL
jgi:hypothetical protein